MKKLVFGICLLVLAIVWATFLIVQNVRSGYRYERDIHSYWTLADKSSTIPAKADYVDKFVAALEMQGLNGQYDALIFPTADNSFDLNLAALKTLQLRLHEIKQMNPSSFEYQTAIQQITAQEQGEAKPMLNVFEGTWTKHNYWYLYDTLQGCEWLLLILPMLIIAAILMFFAIDDL